MHRSPTRRTLATLRDATVAGLVAIAVVACSTAPSAAPSSSASPVAEVILLDRAPANLGCDTIAVSYTSVTFRIDPAANPQVWAVTNLDRLLRVRWDPTFNGRTADDPVVVDRTGTVVARDGDELEIPQGARPALHGHFVCPAEDALYVLDEPAPG